MIASFAVVAAVCANLITRKAITRKAMDIAQKNRDI
jgi:hypothetical protein